jgi:excisionase family DNA binding protein
MSDLLTTRQLQDLLQIDRVTIYRMLSDGRLTGFKVGGQWRFSRQEVEAWLQEQRASLDVAGPPDAAGEGALSSHALPLSCVQAVQSIYAEALDVAAVTTAPDGAPLTDVSNSCKLCDLILATEEGRRRCAASWRPPAGNRQSSPSLRTCHAGLLCLSAPIQVEGEWVASVASCQFVAPPAGGGDETWRAGLPALAADLGLAGGDLLAAADGVRRLPQSHWPRLTRLLQQVADTFCEIGQERLKLVNRLRRIAEMTHV